MSNADPLSAHPKKQPAVVEAQIHAQLAKLIVRRNTIEQKEVKWRSKTTARQLRLVATEWCCRPVRH